MTTTTKSSTVHTIGPDNLIIQKGFTSIEYIQGFDVIDTDGLETIDIDGKTITRNQGRDLVCVLLEALDMDLATEEPTAPAPKPLAVGDLLHTYASDLSLTYDGAGYILVKDRKDRQIALIDFDEYGAADGHRYEKGVAFLESLAATLREIDAQHLVYSAS